MRTPDVRRTAMMFALGLALAAAGSAWLTVRDSGIAPTGPARPAGGEAVARGPSPREADGRSLFELDCGRCHVVEDLTPVLRGADPGASVLELLELLEDHGGSNTAQDRAIVAYLLEVAGRR